MSATGKSEHDASEMQLLSEHCFHGVALVLVVHLDTRDSDEGNYVTCSVVHSLTCCNEHA